jgi:hypothetical protein
LFFPTDPTLAAAAEMQKDTALSMQTSQIEGVAAFVNHLVETGADSQQVAQTIGETCQAVVAALTPIIGSKGAAAMYRRSLRLAGQSYSWLLSEPDGQPTADDVEALMLLLARQTSADAAAGGRLLLRTFYELLGSLIGPSLTERLLRTAWAPFSN